MKFTAQLAHEIRAGRKTQTRRLVDFKVPKFWEYQGQNIYGQALFYPIELEGYDSTKWDGLLNSEFKIGEIFTVNHVVAQCKIINIRVERVQDISEADCCAEGCGSRFTRNYKKPKFKILFDSIYGDGTFDTNPWVWVYELRRLRLDDESFESM